jgi:DNA-binding transcriptional ArsR family regulator
VSPGRGAQDLADLDAVFGALAHQSRRTMLLVLHLRGAVMTSGEIAARFDHSWPTTSRHLKVLQDSGLVRMELRGRERVYRLENERLDGVVRAWLDRFRTA